MEIREWALKILSSESLSDKLFQPEILTDQQIGPPLIISEPGRSYELRLQKRKKEEKLPALHDLKHQDKRAVCLHRFAGHELLAVEMMAYTLLAFPEAPPAFRKGLAHTLKEEQGHVHLYCKRLNELGASFGSMPLYKHFWIHTPYIKSPLHYVGTMSLTLEMANLDFAPTYGNAFLKGGDEKSSELMATILQDEIAHVRFGMQWLRKMKPDTLSEWETWTELLNNSKLTPRRAKGKAFQEEPRRKAGVSPEWIQRLQEVSWEPSQSEAKDLGPLLSPLQGL
jgi:uncharacterized ferritin-like protein (DUF455 family)